MKAPRELKNCLEAVQLGIIKLGSAVGKNKYTVIDQRDINVIRNYKFDARLHLDKNGDGVYVYAVGHSKDCSNWKIPLQQIIWEYHHGPMDEGFKVVHLNKITMDNRLENLSIVSENNSSQCERFLLSEESSLEKSECRNGYNSLYWQAVTQLINEDTPEQQLLSNSACSRSYYTTDGDLISRDCPSFYYFECHYAPCTSLEKYPREFAMCGRCQKARYCGRECQKDDWPSHKEFCNEANRRLNLNTHSSKHRRHDPLSQDVER